MSIQLKIIAFLVSVLALGAAFLGFGHYQYLKGVRVTKATYEAAIEKKKAEAATLLATETAKTRTAEQALQAFTDSQNLKDANHEKTITDLSTRLRVLAGPAGRLRDPHATGCGGGGDSAQGAVASAPGDRPADGAEAGGLLSAELSGLLQRLQLEADTINVAYASCRADALAVRAPP